MQGTYGNGRLVTVFGGSGFVGRHIVRALAVRGYRVRVAVRRPNLAGFLRPLGMVGQVQPVQANLRYPESVEAAMRGSTAAVNAVGILTEGGKQSFEAVNIDGAAAIAAAAHEHGIERLVHVSAIGADPASESRSARSKAAGEERVRESFARAIILRPSVQFGIGDSFFNRFAAIARMLPILPLVGAATRFQPVFVGDVAEAAQRAVDGSIADGLTYELGGPAILTLRKCMEMLLEVIDRRRLLAPVPTPIAKMMGAVLQFLPGKVLTLDQVRQLQIDNVVSADALSRHATLTDIGIQPTALEAILPTYLSRFRAHGQFSRRGNA